MKQITLFIPVAIGIALISLTTCLKAQVKYTVLTAGSTFSPNNITIDVGDTVEFKNMGGTHNVNGTQATFPSNPESFGNSIGTGWTYIYVFNTAGNYAYRCDLHFSMGMVGAVIVNSITGVDSFVKNNDDFDVFPNPTNGYIMLKNVDKFDFIEILNLKGETVFKTSIIESTINVSNLSTGLYIVKAKNSNQVQYKKLIIN